MTLILRSLDGVAYTTGSELDEEHKEIHLSVEYIDKIDSKRKKCEIEGVVMHELVHCFQYNGLGTAPSGLIEGIADFVRLKAGLAPPHWESVNKKEGSWDAGYERTAFFLVYLETIYGHNTLRRVNEKLRVEKYEEKKFWRDLFDVPVEKLWEGYKASLENEEEGSKTAPQKPLMS